METFRYEDVWGQASDDPVNLDPSATFDFQAVWSIEDQVFIGTVKQLPSVLVHANTEAEALALIRDRTTELLCDLRDE